VLIHNAELDRLAKELGDETMKRRSFRNYAIEAMEFMRDIIATNPRNVALDEYLSAYVETETAIGTLNRWLDYADAQIRNGFVRDFFEVRRLLICCLRVFDAVFGTDNLHIKRG
jgi:hypothetical protein